MAKLRAPGVKYQKLKIVRQPEAIYFEFPDDGTRFGYPRVDESKIIMELMDLPRVECETKVLKSELREALGRAHDSSLGKGKVSINLYGPREMSGPVSKTLSDGKLWLQKPDEVRDGVDYENPHYLHLTVDATEADVLANAPQSQAGGTQARTSRGDQLRRMVEEVYQSVDNNTRDLEMIDAGSRVKRTLLP